MDPISNSATYFSYHSSAGLSFTEPASALVSMIKQLKNCLALLCYMYALGCVPCILFMHSNNSTNPYADMLLQALFYKKYSVQSDVWSFGCVMYEIWSLGYKPFEDYSGTEVSIAIIVLSYIQHHKNLDQTHGSVSAANKTGKNRTPHTSVLFTRTMI